MKPMLTILLTVLVISCAAIKPRGYAVISLEENAYLVEFAPQAFWNDTNTHAAFLQHAAKLTLSKHHRYFVVEEFTVADRVVLVAPESVATPITGPGFVRERGTMFSSGSNPQETADARDHRPRGRAPAVSGRQTVRGVVHLYDEKPAGDAVFDALKLIKS